MRADLIVKNIGELVYFRDFNLETINGAAIAVKDGKIAAFGTENEVLESFEISNTTSIIDAENNAVIPAFVDPHTHLIYAGCRHEEFLAKLKGEEYLKLLKEGRGINYTVALTRRESKENLMKLTLKRLNQLKMTGTLTVEIKSGYGLDFENEKKMLEIANMLRKISDIDIVPTFLGAHAIPPEFSSNRASYINLIVNKMIPEFTHLAEFIDIFIDDGAFTVDEAREIFKQAESAGYKIKMHIDELSYTGAAKLATEFSIVSAEHMEYTPPEDLEILKERNVVAVLLPSTYFFMKSKRRPCIEAMRELKLPIALGTDHNPGTSPFYSQPLIMALAVFLYDMSVEEVLLATTLNAAKALNLENTKGNIGIGMDADFLILNAHSFVHLVYEVGSNLIGTIISKGKNISIHSN
ncbi:MAG TPA: imidazolonepropionase [Candidatus Hydrothermia bacterium]|nr:imidazolonepropionase [Candidatus Hydrothermia bacterium]